MYSISLFFPRHTGVSIHHSAACSFFLLFNPCLQPYLFQSFSILNRRNIVFSQTFNEAAWVFLTKRARVYCFLFCAFSYFAVRRASFRSAGAIRFHQFVEKFPKRGEHVFHGWDVFVPQVHALSVKRLLQELCTFGNSVSVCT